ncbi:ABC-three component system protein [Pectobacterium aquaticum]|uniref:ABC-three component system protein n=1 Tax=Pectobacterium aquaticum TaxID=2204145 RepID=UPI000E26E0F5|nr:ABC-three component system protein [Pectobacterium aquaticum]UEM40638.1 GPI inositol-deacylase [Pectobacterium aquaticum]
MSMLEWKRKNGTDSLVLFIHGLKGGSDTWSFNKSISFPILLCGDIELENYDIACFEYFTNFTNLFGNKTGMLRRLFNNTKKREINLPVSEISQLLVTEMDLHLGQYNNIIIIAHSMGGLIAKSCILKLINYERSRNIKGFISLAVPHFGSTIANIMSSLVTKNIQISDLSVFSNETDALNRDWLNANNLPKAKFVYGTNDNIVKKQSALPLHIQEKDYIAVNEDHQSICKPESIENNVYAVVKKFIIEISNEESDRLTQAEFIDENQYDNEFFVLKLMLADVHNDFTNHAKEYYYNAELARNLFTSDYDRNLLGKIYRQIKSLYQTQYQLALSNRLSSDQLVASIHSKIDQEDKKELSTVLSNLDSLHKKGMLHQLANKLNRDVIWSADTTVESLSILKGKK